MKDSHMPMNNGKDLYAASAKNGLADAVCIPCAYIRLTRSTGNAHCDAEHRRKLYYDRRVWKGLPLVIATTEKAVRAIVFAASQEETEDVLRGMFPKWKLEAKRTQMQELAVTAARPPRAHDGTVESGRGSD